MPKLKGSTYRASRPRKRRFRGNQYTLKKQETPFRNISTEKIIGIDYDDIADSDHRNTTNSDNQEKIKTESAAIIKDHIYTTEEMSGQFETVLIKTEIEYDEYLDTDIYKYDRDVATGTVCVQWETNQVVIKDNDLKAEVEYDEFRSDAIVNLDDDRGDIKIPKMEGYSDTNHGILERDSIVRDDCDGLGSDIGFEVGRDVVTRVFDDYNNDYDILDKVVEEDIKLHTEVDLEDEDFKSMHMNNSITTCSTHEDSKPNKHILTEGERPYKCSTCDRRFTRKNDLVAHTRIHTGERPYKCITCEGSFKQMNALVAHRRIHTGERPYKCNMCDRSFTMKPHLDSHIRIHTGERPYKCTTCERSFKQKSELVTHSRIHTGERPYKCKTCDRSFRQKSSLVAHIRTHTGERPHKCDMCDRSFTIKPHLNDHMRKHTGERPYKCNICDRSFTMKAHLNDHIRSHTGERPYKCIICDRSFKMKAHMNDHVRTHTGERPYKCSMCNKSFTRNSDLVRHNKCCGTFTQSGSLNVNI